MDELTRFLNVWEQETAKTAKLLDCLPRDQYDFRPDAGGRSLGELAWHLAEGDAYITHGIERGQFDFGVKPAGIERPKKVEELAPAFERVHSDAVERVKKLKPEDFDRADCLLHNGAVPDPGSAVELRADARHPSPWPARIDVPALRRHAGRGLRADARADAGEAGGRSAITQSASCGGSIRPS